MRKFCFIAILTTGLAIMPAFLAQSAPVGQADPAPAAAWSLADASILIAAIKSVGDDGLDPGDYRPLSGSDADLNRAALAYFSDLRRGRGTLRYLDSDVGLPSVLDDDAAALASALKNHRLASFLTEAAPQTPQYGKLKAALAFYRGIRDQGGWAQLPPGLGFQGPDVDLLRNRLTIEDPGLASEPDLTAALKRFQEQHGLPADGRIGARTLAELNITADARIDQIMANMERWRWLPHTFEPDYIAVNVPDASLSLVLNGREMLQSRVVVGKPRTPTPILRAEGAGITVNPPWNVPDSIARKEILPKLKANPTYLRGQDMILLNGPPGDPYGLQVRWRDIPAGTFPYRLQQHPGQANALGTIKIELPNRFDVYLHDTPAKRAFAGAQRDISHGCVRVEQILPLASYALSENLDAMTAISDAVASGETQYFPLKRKLPVYFLYWTAFPASDGTLQFRPDIYGRDLRLIAALRQVPTLRVSANYPNCVRG